MTFVEYIHSLQVLLHLPEFIFPPEKEGRSLIVVVARIIYESRNLISDTPEYDRRTDIFLKKWQKIAESWYFTAPEIRYEKWYETSLLIPDLFDPTEEIAIKKAKEIWANLV